MKRLSLAFVVVLGLMLAFTPSMSAYAEVQLPANIKFKGHALGICGVGRTLHASSKKKRE
jgi:hydrogenase/urease accessory protein HupE